MKKQKIKKFPFSKKVMTGLFAAAMGLSIWTPASHAETPEKNGYYSIHLAANTALKWNVDSASTDNERLIRLWKEGLADNEQFAFFPLDGGLYAIVNKNSGKPVVADGGRGYVYNGQGSLPNDQALRQMSWNGADNQKWYLRDKGNNKYEIVNQGNQKVASYAWEGTAIQNIEYVDLDNSNPSDNDRLFNISAARSTFTVPTLPATGARPNAPAYDPNGPIDQQLSQTSNSVIVGSALIPCIMVKDSSADDYTKIHNSPYYVLQKEEYWEKTRSATISPGGTDKYFVKNGVSTVDQQRMTDTLAMNFGADLGLKTDNLSASIKYSISKTLQTEVTKTTTNASEESEEKTIPSAYGKETGYTVYQLVTKYTLKRTDGTTVSDPWSVRDKNQIVVRSIPNQP
ncbi:RICIN domain-containing protein [Bacillus paramycoides]|uniref:RICIN domain-containing protein n=1 Tax=Bacillus paramycoides TaxID=2026194 RepID=UPI002E23DDA9|nr:RICIN domain-containing protein [Bacillus paramycoides]